MNKAIGVYKRASGDTVLLRVKGEGRDTRTTNLRRGEPIEIGYGSTHIYPHQVMGLGQWVLPTRRTLEANEDVTMVLRKAPDGAEVYSWCPNSEITTLQAEISRRGLWEFGVRTEDPSSAQVWVALVRHLMIRRKLQDPQGIAHTINSLRQAAQGAVVKTNDPILRNNGFKPKGDFAASFIEWILEVCHLDKSTATAWQQAVRT